MIGISLWCDHTRHFQTVSTDTFEIYDDQIVPCLQCLQNQFRNQSGTKVLLFVTSWLSTADIFYYFTLFFFHFDWTLLCCVIFIWFVLSQTTASWCHKVVVVSNLGKMEGFVSGRPSNIKSMWNQTCRNNSLFKPLGNESNWICLVFSY